MSAWPKEVVEWLRKNVPGRSTKEVASLINLQGFREKYGMTFSEGSIKNAKNRYKIRSGTPGGTPKGFSIKYPEGMEDYIRSIAEGKGSSEIAELVSAHFGIEFTARQCAAYKKNHDIASGVDCRYRKGHEPANKGKPMSKEQYEKCKATMYKPGNVPANYMEVGEYSHTSDGYQIRKVKEKGNQWERFEFVHRIVWEEYNGPIPEGKKVSFLDGNRDNCSIENLILLDKEEHLEMNRKGLRFSDPERTRAGALIAKARVTVKHKKRSKKKDGNLH